MPLPLNIKDIIDIFLVAVLFYQAYRLMRGTGATNIFIGIMVFVVTWFLVTRIFQMQLLGALFDAVFNVGAIALIVIFQNEIRNFFSRIGSRQWRFLNWLNRIFRIKKLNEEDLTFPAIKIVMACRHMSHSKTGALIIISRHVGLGEYIETGDRIDAEINTRLIENIFFKNSPLHDGALIITDNRLTAAGAILPVSRNPEIPRHLGLRHRAALGISEHTDAIAIIVSEETGTISVAMDGQYKLNLTPEQLENLLAENIT